MLPIQETSYWHSESILKVTTIRYDPWCALQVLRYVNSTATSLQVGRPKFNALVQNGVRWPLKTRICGVAWVPSREGMFEATHILDIARNSCLPDDHYLVNWLTRDTLCRCSQHVYRSKRTLCCCISDNRVGPSNWWTLPPGSREIFLKKTCGITPKSTVD